MTTSILIARSAGWTVTESVDWFITYATIGFGDYVMKDFPQRIHMLSSNGSRSHQGQEKRAFEVAETARIFLTTLALFFSILGLCLVSSVNHGRYWGTEPPTSLSQRKNWGSTLWQQEQFSRAVWQRSYSSVVVRKAKDFRGETSKRELMTIDFKHIHVIKLSPHLKVMLHRDEIATKCYVCCKSLPSCILFIYLADC